MVIKRDSEIRFVRKGYPHATVLIDDEVLSPKKSLAVVNHSPDGFEWGYGGSGPSQVALALLLEVGLSETDALSQHMAYKFDVIQTLDWEDRMSGLELLNWLSEKGVVLHRDYTYKLVCPLCGNDFEMEFAGETHKMMADVFEVRNEPLVLVGNKRCESCQDTIRLHRALSVHGVITMGVSKLDESGDAVEWRYPQEFSIQERELEQD